MTLIQLYLLLIVYAIIGIVIGRVWKTVCVRRKYEDFEAMHAAVGVFWPAMLIIIPMAFLLDRAIRYIIAPSIRWILRTVDRVVERVIPEKAS